jgi:hypothetical protein
MMAPPSGGFQEPTPDGHGWLGWFGRQEPPLSEKILSPEQIGQLRDLRVVVLDMAALVANVRTGDASIATYADFLTASVAQMRTILQSVSPDDIPAESMDAIRHISNLVDLLSANPVLRNPASYGPGADSQAMARDLNMLDSLSAKIVFQIGMLTVPARLNRWLEQARTGYYVPFHEVFDDEIPSYEDRVRILKFLSWSPRTIQYGLVDSSTGLIYRYGRSGPGRIGSLLLVVALVLVVSLGVMLTASLTTWIPIPGWPFAPADGPRLLGLWLALLAGIVVHVAVATGKRLQSQSELPPPLPVGDLPRLMSAKFGQIMFKIVLALIGLFGSLLLTGLGTMTGVQAFLIGYSLDSVIELFGMSMEQRSTAQITTLKQQLGVR